MRLAAPVGLGLDRSRRESVTSSIEIGAPSPSTIVTISAPSLSAAIVAARVDPAPPQAITSPSTNPTASPRTKRPAGVVAGRRRDGAGAGLGERLGRAGSAFSVSDRARVELDHRDEPGLLGGAAEHPRLAIGERGRVLGGEHDVGEFGSTSTP